MDDLRKIVESIVNLSKRVRVLESRPYLSSPDLIVVPWTVHEDSMQSLTISNTQCWISTVDYTATIKSAKIALYVATKNNVAEYWSITIKNSSGDLKCSLDTTGMLPSVWNTMDFTVVEPSITRADICLIIEATKHGYPGAISGGSPMVYLG